MTCAGCSRSQKDAKKARGSNLAIEAREWDQAQISELAQWAQAETGETFESINGDQSHRSENASDADAEYGINLEAVKRQTALRGIVLLPC
jgi:hypothetical protein